MGPLNGPTPLPDSAGAIAAPGSGLAPQDTACVTGGTGWARKEQVVALPPPFLASAAARRGAAPAPGPSPRLVARLEKP